MKITLNETKYFVSFKVIFVAVAHILSHLR